MSFYADNEFEKGFPFDIDEIIGRVIDCVLKTLDIDVKVSVNILITDNAGIRTFNRDYRDIDSETDVLSFPAVDYEAPGDLSIALSDKCSYFDPDTDELMLGDVIINGDRVYSQADEFGHSYLREFAFLLTHSMLHLFGFDHIEKEDEEEMFPLQERIMETLGITRDN